MNPTGTPRRIHVDSTWVLRRYVLYQILTNFHVIPTYFFDEISVIEKSTSFPRTFFDVISMVKKSNWLPRTFFDVISLVKISTVFLLTFFRLNFDGRKTHFVSMNSASFLVSCKLMKTFEGCFLCK